MACDPNNPIKSGACPIENTGPPDVILSLRGAIQTPEQLGSSKKGDYQTIGKNLGALDYYATSLGEAPQFQGYGIRKAYNTGIECSNLKGNTAHRLADGTAVGAGGYGVVPRLIGSLTSLIPGDIVSSATTSTECKMMMIHENSDVEANSIRSRGMAGVPASNKVQVTNANGVDYVGMDEKCRSGELKGCNTYPVQTSDINPIDENFRGGRRRRHRRWRRGPRHFGPYFRRRHWYRNLPVYYSPPIVIDRPVYYRPKPEVVVIEKEKTETEKTDNITPLLVLAGVVAAGSIIALRS